MNRKLIGAILLSAAGLVTAIGAVGAQIALALCQSALYQAGVGRSDPPRLADASLHWAVILVALILVILALIFLFSREKTE